jgi:hypothetical protein
MNTLISTPLKSNGGVNFFIAHLGVSRREKGGKQALECSIVDKYFEKQEEEAPRVEESSKKFFVLVDIFCVFVVEQGEVMAQNQETTKLLNHIAKGSGAIGNTPSGGFAKVTIKVKLSDFFAKKKTKTKRVWP